MVELFKALYTDIIIHTVCVLGGGVRAAAFTLTLFAGGGFHAMRQRLQSELNHLSAEDP